MWKLISGKQHTSRNCRNCNRVWPWPQTQVLSKVMESFLIVKPELYKQARESIEGKWGKGDKGGWNPSWCFDWSNKFREGYVYSVIRSWENEIIKLWGTPKAEPRAGHTPFTHGDTHKWKYSLTTMPNTDLCSTHFQMLLRVCFYLNSQIDDVLTITRMQGLGNSKPINLRIYI